ncbi:unnamed protein product [Rhizophagus irregularis]|nr:unnamed protein product [Rhizophagus irregularis]CAB5359774.1 unnamed protein product [Rhizophagus irregularis]
MELNRQTMNKENVLEVCLGFIPLNLLDKYIRRMVAVRIRKFEGQERLDPLQQGDGLELSHISTIMMFMLAILIMMIIKMENI